MELKLNLWVLSTGQAPHVSGASVGKGLPYGELRSLVRGAQGPRPTQWVLCGVSNAVMLHSFVYILRWWLLWVPLDHCLYTFHLSSFLSLPG